MKQQGDFFIAIDVGSSRIVGALIEKTSTKPKLHAVSYHDLPFQSTLSQERYTRDTGSILRRCADSLNKELKGKRYTAVHCTLSSLLYEPRLSFKKSVFEHDTLIEKQHVDTLIQSNVKTVPGTLEHTVMQYKVNGYPTMHPIGKIGRTIEAALYESTGDTETIQLLTDNLKTGFPDVPISFHSFSLSAWAVIRNIMHDPHFIFMDFGGEITDMVISKSGVLEKTVSIPFGKNSIMRELMKETGVSREIAESLIRMHAAGTLSPQYKNGVERALASCRQHWDTLFLGTLEHGTLDVLLPQDLYLLSNPILMPIVRGYLENTACDRYVFIGKPFKIHEIRNTTLLPFCTIKEGLETPDPFMVISSLFFDTLQLHE